MFFRSETSGQRETDSRARNIAKSVGRRGKKTGVDFIKCFASYTHLSHPLLNFYASKSLPKLGIGHELFDVGHEPVYEIDPLSLTSPAPF